MIKANLGDQWTITLIAGIPKFSSIPTIWIPVTAIYLEDTFFDPVGTRPSIRILNSWEPGVTLAIAEVVIHVFAVLTQGLGLSAASKAQSNATVIVA